MAHLQPGRPQESDADELVVYKVGDLSGDGGRILIIGLNIPRSPSTYRDFAAAMSLAETGLLKALQGNI